MINTTTVLIRITDKIMFLRIRLWPYDLMFVLCWLFGIHI